MLFITSDMDCKGLPIMPFTKMDICEVFLEVYGKKGGHRITNDLFTVLYNSIQELKIL